MKLEVGMYVRTKKGYIYKLSRYEEDYNRWISSEENDWYPVYESLVTKASHNITDLIEEGDYVNGECVISVAVDLEGERYITDGSCRYSNEEIKTIVTKEQFESMSYKVN